MPLDFLAVLSADRGAIFIWFMCSDAQMHAEEEKRSASGRFYLSFHKVNAGVRNFCINFIHELAFNKKRGYDS